MAGMSKRLHRSWQDDREMNAMNRDQASQPLSTPLVISAIWWALILSAALSTLVR
jgi:hypothetical protein